MPKATKKKEALTPLQQALKEVHEQPYFILDPEGGSDEFADTEADAIKQCKSSMEHPDSTDMSHIVIYKAIAVMRREPSPVKVIK